MRTIRHRAAVEARDRDGECEVSWEVTVPWRDGPENENHGDPERPQFTFHVEGNHNYVEDVTLDADATEDLYQALHEARWAVGIAADA